MDVVERMSDYVRRNPGHVQMNLNIHRGVEMGLGVLFTLELFTL